VCICPATIATELLLNRYPDPEHPFRKLRENMIPMGRVGLPEEVANLALFLASDDAPFINGAAIPIDGGWTAGKFIHNFEQIITPLAKK
jgi:NAD(P)-dependent dehydrogenase (short-subunit alcohol dehydrogenase family)